MRQDHDAADDRGFEEPTRGAVRLDGQDVTAAPPNKRNVNMVFQSYALFPHMNVFENVAFGLRRKSGQGRGHPAGRRDAGDRRPGRPRAASAAGAVRRPAAAIALARALVNHPRALLLDEPLGALDLKLRQAMQFELKRIQREVGITFVYVTHDQNEALTMSDRIAVMNDGAIEQLGPPREIYEHPATGSWPASSAPRTCCGAVQVTGGLGDIEVTPDERITCRLGRSAAAGGAGATVRPEKITWPPGPARRRLALRGTVTEVVYLGTSTSFAVTTTTGADIVVFQQNSSRREPLSRGGDVWLSWDPEHSYLIG